MIDSVVVGAGIWGAALARRLAESGRHVLVVEKRASVGGNCRCEIDSETGIEIHAYGSHIFHTHNLEVWNFIRRFTEFNGYQHKVLACHAGRMYHLPLGLTLINKFFNVELKPDELAGFMTEERRRAIFDAFFRGYTSKQWGRAPEDVDPGVIKRVPVRSNYDTNYFNDYWQGIPADGYNALFERMLDHGNITVKINEEASLPLVEKWSAMGVCVYYSGPLDRLFNNKFGPLPWRSLRFEVEKLARPDYQGTTVVNYTDTSVPFTRIHEFKHYHPNRRFGSLMEREGAENKTIIMREFPKAWQIGDEPYYPIANSESATLLKKYQEEACKISGLVVGGRLGQYQYLDMDQAILSALHVELR